MMSMAEVMSAREYKQWWSQNVDQPYGLCWCGCGRVTRIARERDSRRSMVVGEPVRFIHGHNGFSAKPDYVIEDRGYKTPCWIWLRSKKPDGYGLIRKTAKNSDAGYAHRVYYERKHGSVPDGLVVDHLCEVPCCVNPDHLEAVRQRYNVRRGKAAKLKPWQVLSLRRAKEECEFSNRELAAVFGISAEHVGRIVSGQYWKGC